MRTAIHTLGALLLLLSLGANGSGADVTRAVDSAACPAAPVIDGVIGDDEWRAARAHRFEMTMVRIDPASTETRACELRVMNSANALYVALRVPDATVDESLSPMVLDGAILAFCQGDQVRPGDDRKLISPGIYRDKSVNAPGKGDSDDRKQDGRGGMTRENGVCSFEWAVPLDSGDKDDLRAKPGDSFRFNLVYLDAFQVPITRARMGGVYGVYLDRADAWGTLRLSADVKDDGGSAFQAPAWIKALFDRPLPGPAARLRFEGATLIPGTSQPAPAALFSFRYRDERGAEREARAKIYVPHAERTGAGMKVPLFFAAGYELPDAGSGIYLRRGWAVASPRDLPTNPLIRTANPDIAFLHMARALPFVDDSRVVIGGGSAGGYMTLMLAAETFPLAGAMADVPPVNWGYNAAYFFKQLDKAGPQNGGAPRIPFVSAVGTMLRGCTDVYGGEFGDATWFVHSPVAQVSTITCPVSALWTTADMLVPINQVGSRWVQPFDRSKFPEGFTMDPAKLVDSREGRLTLMDVLSASDYEVFGLSVPQSGKEPASKTAARPRELPVSADKRWSIIILDEGPPEPAVGHLKHNMATTRNAFLDRAGSGKIAARQLTAMKLERLMDRYAGKEWLPSRLSHLDQPESERYDVLRGLRTYVSSGPENARTFAELYSRLPAARRVLEPEVVKDLESAGSLP